VNNTQQRILSSPAVMAMIASQTKQEVALSSRIRANRERVFHALSIPEYIEAWFKSPVEDELRFLFHSVTSETFRIDLFRGMALQTRVQSCCTILSSEQIRYSWKITSPGQRVDTVVDLRLVGSFEGCTLGLKHIGFRDAVESAWYEQVWRRSLDALCRLMEK
jgi:uncharacterized protein YndB with AHSA1/START domain